VTALRLGVAAPGNNVVDLHRRHANGAFQYLHGLVVVKTITISSSSHVAASDDIVVAATTFRFVYCTVSAVVVRCLYYCSVVVVVERRRRVGEEGQVRRFRRIVRFRYFQTRKFGTRINRCRFVTTNIDFFLRYGRRRGCLSATTTRTNFVVGTDSLRFVVERLLLRVTGKITKPQGIL